MLGTGEFSRLSTKLALLSLIAEDARWHVFGDSAMAGTVRGRDQIWEKFLAPQWDTPRQLEVHDVLDNGEHVVALGELSFSSADGEVRFKTVEVYHHKDGVLTERWFFVDRDTNSMGCSTRSPPTDKRPSSAPLVPWRAARGCSRQPSRP